MGKEPHGAAYDADESVTVTNASKALTSGTYGDAQFAEITVETATVRFWLGGTVPSATTGHLLHPGDVLKLNRQEQIVGIRFFRRDGIDATLRVSYGN